MKNLYFFGDSITYGYGVTKDYSWPYIFCEKNGIVLRNYSVNGLLATKMLRQIESFETQIGAEAFYMIGINDTLLGLTNGLKEVLENIAQQLDKKFDKVYSGIYPVFDFEELEATSMATKEYYIHAYNLISNYIIEINEKYNFKTIDFSKAINSENNDDVYIDGLHLNRYGNELLALYFQKTYGKID